MVSLSLPCLLRLSINEKINVISEDPKLLFERIIRDILSKSHFILTKFLIEIKSKFEFVTGDAQNLPFKNEEFDRVFSTCLLHHVDDVLSVLLEVRRVTQTGGEIAFVFPTDPGILNQLIKRLISYRKIRKMTDIPPELFYALDHKNHVLSISELIKFVFALDELVFHYRPFRFKSWNMNFLIVAQIIKKS